MKKRKIHPAFYFLIVIMALSFYIFNENKRVNFVLSSFLLKAKLSKYLNS